MLAPQFILTDNTGFNIGAHFDFGFNQSSNFRALLGAGSTNFYSGVFYKWIPIPDYNDQPAIGLTAGVLYASLDGGNSSLSFRLQPLISKKFQADWAELTPYASLPFGLATSQGDTIYPLQFVVGSEIKPHELKKLSFFAEFGLNISRAFNYVTLAAALEFDEDSGFKIE